MHLVHAMTQDQSLTCYKEFLSIALLVTSATDGFPVAPPGCVWQLFKVELYKALQILESHRHRIAASALVCLCNFAVGR